jgi:hypothetical protein
MNFPIANIVHFSHPFQSKRQKTEPRSEKLFYLIVGFAKQWIDKV